MLCSYYYSLRPVNCVWTDPHITGLQVLGRFLPHCSFGIFLVRLALANYGDISGFIS
jgi:hypothetical protein